MSLRLDLQGARLASAREAPRSFREAHPANGEEASHSHYTDSDSESNSDSEEEYEGEESRAYKEKYMKSIKDQKTDLGYVGAWYNSKI